MLQIWLIKQARAACTNVHDGCSLHQELDVHIASLEDKLQAVQSFAYLAALVTQRSIESAGHAMQAAHAERTAGGMVHGRKANAHLYIAGLRSSAAGGAALC